MISGKSFYELCHWNICNRYPIKFQPNLVKDGDFVFINLDNILDFIKFWKTTGIKSKINLITHNSDMIFTDDMYIDLSTFCLNVYSINSISNHGVKIPLGFSDRLVPIIQDRDAQTNDKGHLVYMNFKIYQSVALERKDCYNHFKNESWVLSEDNVPEVEFYKNLKLSKYSFCPIGVGLDTHRFYESIFLNTIPIVIRNGISDLHSKLPCIIIDSWSEITQDKLNNEYKQHYDNLIEWKKNNDWLNPKYWLK